MSSRLRVRLERPGFLLDVDASWDERVAVLFGPSGSGKTTLLEVVLGLHRRARPLVRFAGEWLDDPGRGLHRPLEARGLGWVPQDATLFPHLRVEENLRFGLRRAGASGERALERAIDVLEIGDLLARRTDALSGGERQRAALARAIASAPRGLLLDEPLASLDLALRARVLPLLLRVRDELGLPMLYITHDPDEAMLLGEVALVLDGGRLVASGAPREVLWSRPVRPLSAALGVENVLELRALEARDGGCVLESDAGLRLSASFAAAPGGRVRVGLRAEDVLLALDPPGRISARNVIGARVMACEDQGGEVLVRLLAPDPIAARVTTGAVRELGLAPGAAVHLVIKASALRRLA
jgi:molybdate transport system ATP-binding protein